jgi:hypothetical protein
VGGFAAETKKAPMGLICLEKRDLAMLHHHLDFRYVVPGAGLDSRGKKLLVCNSMCNFRGILGCPIRVCQVKFQTAHASF